MRLQPVPYVHGCADTRSDVRQSPDEFSDVYRCTDAHVRDLH
jgi:hypothetical protein